MGLTKGTTVTVGACALIVAEVLTWAPPDTGALLLAGCTEAAPAPAALVIFLPLRPANAPLALAPELLGASGAIGVADTCAVGEGVEFWAKELSVMFFFWLITSRDIAAAGVSSLFALTIALMLLLGTAPSGLRTAIWGAVSRVGGIESSPTPGATTSAGASSVCASPPRLRRWLRRVFGRSGMSPGRSLAAAALALCG